MDNVTDGQNNRVFAAKFDPTKPNILYSGGWSCSVLQHDLRERKKIGDIFGPYICGESIDIKDEQISVGSYSSDGYLKVYDTKTMKKLDDIKWDSASGKGGFIYQTKYIPGSGARNNNILLAGSANANEIKIFMQEEDSKTYREINQASGFNGGVLSVDVARSSRSIVVGTQEGEFIVFNAEGFYGATEATESDV